MTEKIIPKDPNAVLDYAFNWAGDDDHDPWLEDGDTISSHVVTVDTGITKDSDSESSGVVTVWLSGGTAGTDYTIACKIDTSAGRTDERSIVIHCEER